MDSSRVAEFQRQLTLEYPELCRDCSRVAATVVTLTMRGNRSEDEIRAVVREDAEKVRDECIGQITLTDASCFQDQEQCYLQSDAYIEGKTTIVD